jgi:hypothetical protein
MTVRTMRFRRLAAWCRAGDMNSGPPLCGIVRTRGEPDMAVPPGGGLP